MDDGAQAGCFWMPHSNSYSYLGLQHRYNYMQYLWSVATSYACDTFDWYRGQRVGEASNPGPYPTEFTVTGQNICSMNAFLSDGRLQDFQDDICVFTETAATAVTLDRAAKRIMGQRRHMVATGPSALRSFSDGRTCVGKGTGW